MFVVIIYISNPAPYKLKIILLKCLHNGLA
nr:MAG TPA: hypothetical protein [Caudoviricetes sp.]